MKNDDVSIYCSLLREAYQQARYYRAFHHIIYTLFMTAYCALLGIGITRYTSMPSSKIPIILGIVLIILFFIILPIYIIIQIFFGYHRVITQISSVAGSIGKYLWTTINKHPEDINKDSLDTFFFRKYIVSVNENISSKFIGPGHWFFTITLSIVVIVNIIVWLLLIE
jgi:hypothetical protein